MSLTQIFSGKPVVGMVHLLPLPGSPGWGGSMGAVVDRALADATALIDGGLAGLIVENFGDVPFYPGPVPPETVASMAVAVREVTRTVQAPVGVNVLRNDGAAALSVAAACGARFVRINVHVGTMFTDQGRLDGQAHETLRRRSSLDPAIAILADVFVKHGVAPAGLSLEAAARDAVDRGLADGLVVTGSATGVPTDAAELERVKAAVPHTPVWVGSGVNAGSARSLLGSADGLIVGSALKEDGITTGPVDPNRVRRLVDTLPTR